MSFTLVDSELGKWLEKMGWPTRVDTASPSDDTIKKFQNTVRCLSRLTRGKSSKLQGPDVSRPVILLDYQESSSLAHVKSNYKRNFKELPTDFSIASFVWHRYWLARSGSGFGTTSAVLNQRPTTQSQSGTLHK